MYKYLIIILSLLTISCEKSKEINYNLPFEGEKKVIYGFLIAGEKSRIELLQTTPVLEDNPDFKNKDSVSFFLSENGVNIDTFSLVNNLYYSKKQIYQNKEYSINIKYNKKNLISNNIVIPEKTIIKNCNYIFNNDTSFLTLKLDFEDNSSTSDYYVFKLKKYIGGQVIQEKRQINTQLFSFNSILVDKDIKNNRYIEDVATKIFTYDTNGVYTGFKKIDSLKIDLLHVSEDFYNFQKSINRNNVEIGSIGTYSNPIWSNIPNAYGVIGGVNLSQYMIKVK